MAANTFRLITLGRVALLAPDGTAEPSLGTRRRKLAVLAYLAAARRPVQRDELVELFWGGQPEERARHSLTDALSHLRRVLGPEALATRQAQIALAADVALTTDTAELVSAAARGDYGGVLELYQGPFLAGVEVEDSPAFEKWRLRERERWRGLFVEASELRCAALAGECAWGDAAEAARRWLEADPLSGDAALALLSALRAQGTRVGHRQALSEYRQLAALLSREYDWEPPDRVSALAATIAREEEALAGGAPEEVPAYPAASVPESALATPAAASGSGAVAAAPSSARVSAAGTRGRRPRRWYGVVGALATAALLVTGMALTRARKAVPPAVPSVAVLDIRDLSGVRGDEWLEAGLPQMIGAELSRADALDVVPPERVREVRRRGELDGPLTDGQALDLGRRLGASIVVRGGFSHGGAGYVLDLTLHDAATGRVVGIERVSGRDLLSTADAAAARLAEEAGRSRPGPGLTGVETTSLDAYQHYMRAVQARDEGRADEIAGELDEALRLDPGFGAALALRLELARLDGDRALERRTAAAILRADRRASAFDRLEAQIRDALDEGQRARSEALAREMLRRYPRDPRAYGTAADVLFSHGDFAGQEAVLERALALDSLGMEAGHGACVPCLAYGGLANVRAIRGDMAGAIGAASRWVHLEPDMPAAWGTLAGVLAMAGDYHRAIASQQRALSLDPTDGQRGALARLSLMAGDYARVDSMVRVWEESPSAETDPLAADMRVTLARERGQFRAALGIFQHTAALGGLDLVEANTLDRLGQPERARRIYERVGHPSDGTEAQRARAFCWAHALEAEGLFASSAPAARLALLADSIDVAARRSYYARDWHLAHHVRGLVALREGRWADAVREFGAARFGVAGWTATELRLAQAQLALRQPRAAIRTLQEGKMGPLDGMGRYIPRTELDYMLAQAFQAAGQADSARAYAALVRRSWAEADPEVRLRLAGLPR